MKPSYYSLYLFEGAFGFDSKDGFGSLSGLKHRPLEHHGTQLKKKIRVTFNLTNQIRSDCTCSQSNNLYLYYSGGHLISEPAIIVPI